MRLGSGVACVSSLGRTRRRGSVDFALTESSAMASGVVR